MVFTSYHDRSSNGLPPDGRASILTTQSLQLALHCELAANKSELNYIINVCKASLSPSKYVYFMFEPVSSNLNVSNASVN